MKIKTIKKKTLIMFSGSRDEIVKDNFIFPDGAVKESFSFATVEGGKITFSCNDDYQVIGVEIDEI